MTENKSADGIQKTIKLTPHEKVKLARHPKRPNALDYINSIFHGFIEMSGDGLYGDDGAMVTGIARLRDIPCAVIAEVKGKTIEENNIRNFGSPHPEGYRKARRIAEMSERFNLPVFCFIDTSGAYPGIGAEERGQARAIAENLMVFSRLKTQIIVTVIGEGGSGGALAIGVGDAILMLENAIYSVISPEGCSSILWKTGDKVVEAASSLKLTANDLLTLGAIDEIVPEGVPGAHENFADTFQNLEKALSINLARLSELPVKELLALRYKKFRGMFS